MNFAKYSVGIGLLNLLILVNAISGVDSQSLSAHLDEQKIEELNSSDSELEKKSSWCSWDNILGVAVTSVFLYWCIRYSHYGQQRWPIENAKKNLRKAYQKNVQAHDTLEANLLKVDNEFRFSLQKNAADIAYLENDFSERIKRVEKMVRETSEFIDMGKLDKETGQFLLKDQQDFLRDLRQESYEIQKLNDELSHHAVSTEEYEAETLEQLKSVQKLIEKIEKKIN